MVRSRDWSRGLATGAGAFCALGLEVLAAALLFLPAAPAAADGLTSGGGARSGGSTRLIDGLGPFVAGTATSVSAHLSTGLIAIVTAPVPIVLVSFAGIAVEEGVRLEWVLSDDSDPAGFMVYRAAAAVGPFERLTPRPLPPEARAFTDETAPTGAALWYRLSGIERSGGEVHFGAIQVTPLASPARLALHQNYPNPARPATTFALDLPEAGPVRLRVFDVAGRLVATVYDGRLEAGRHTIPWNGEGTGGRLAGGVYFYNLEAMGGVVTRKMVVGR